MTQPEAAQDPQLALYGGGSDGLQRPRAFLAAAAAVAAPGATIVMEHAESQGEALVQEAQALGLRDAQTRCDLGGRPRFLQALA